MKLFCFVVNPSIFYDGATLLVAANTYGDAVKIVDSHVNDNRNDEPYTKHDNYGSFPVLPRTREGAMSVKDSKSENEYWYLFREFDLNQNMEPGIKLYEFHWC